MKRFLIFFVIIAVFGFNAMAQTKNKPYFVVASERMNILYAGTPNLVSIAASVSPKKLRIDWGGVTAIYLGFGRYDVYVPDSLAGKQITITVSKGKNKNLGSYTFRVKPFPEPMVFVGSNVVIGCHMKDIPKDLILLNPLIFARNSPDFNYDLRWSVLSYNVTFIINNILEPPITIDGYRFSEEVISKIENAPLGTIIVFSDIKIQSIAGRRDIEKMIIIRIKDDD